MEVNILMMQLKVFVFPSRFLAFNPVLGLKLLKLSLEFSLSLVLVLARVILELSLRPAMPG